VNAKRFVGSYKVKYGVSDINWKSLFWKCGL